MEQQNFTRFPFLLGLNKFLGKWNGHGEVRILLGCGYLLAQMDQNCVYQPKSRTPDEQYQNI
jgi:hypothetical protein